MKIRISDPKLPDGYEIYLTDLNATLLNNEEVEIDDDTVAEYETRTGKKLVDILTSKKFGGPGRPKVSELDSLTKPALVELAVEKGLEVSKNMTKEQIIATINQVVEVENNEGGEES